MEIEESVKIGQKYQRKNRIKTCPFCSKNGLGVSVGVSVGVSFRLVNSNPYLKKLYVKVAFFVKIPPP